MADPSKVYWVANGADETAVIAFWDGTQVTTASIAEVDAWPGGKLTGSIRAVGAGKIVASSMAAGFGGYSEDWRNKYLHVFDAATLEGPTVVNPPIELTSYTDLLDMNPLKAGGHYDPATDTFWISDPYTPPSGTYTYMVLNSDLSFSRWAGPISDDHWMASYLAARTMVIAVEDMLYRCGGDGYYLNRYNMTTDLVEASHFLGTGASVRWRELVGYSETYGLLFVTETRSPDPLLPYGYWLESYLPDEIPWLDYDTWANSVPTAPVQPSSQRWYLGQPWESGTLGPPEAQVQPYPYGTGWLKSLDDTRVAFAARDSVVPIVDNGGAWTVESPYLEEGEMYAVWTLDLATGEAERMFGIPYRYFADGTVTDYPYAEVTGDNQLLSLHFDFMVAPFLGAQVGSRRAFRR